MISMELEAILFELGTQYLPLPDGSHTKPNSPAIAQFPNVGRRCMVLGWDRWKFNMGVLQNL